MIAMVFESPAMQIDYALCSLVRWYNYMLQHKMLGSAKQVFSN